MAKAKKEITNILSAKEK